MFQITFSQSQTIPYVSQLSAETSPVVVVVDVTSLKALDVRAYDLFSASSLPNGYYFVTIEDFDKIGFHLTKIGFLGTFRIVFCTGSETGEIVYYEASMDAADTIDANESVKILEMPKVMIASGQTIGLNAGTKVGVSSIDTLPAVAIQEGQSVNVGTMPAVSLQDGQSVNVGTMPAVSIAAGQQVGLTSGTKVGVSAIDAMPQVQIAPNQGVNITNVPEVAIADNQEIGLKAGSTVGINGAIQATIANDQAIGVYPVRRN